MALESTIQWLVNGITILLMITAASMAIKKKNNTAVIVVIAGNLLVYAVTQSPLFCWIVSIACIIWINKSASQVTTASAQPAKEQPQAAKKESKAEGKKIKCRFCKKMYSAEYNGCPYCKKK